MGIRFQENKGQIVDTDGKPCPDIMFTATVSGARLYFRRDGISTVFIKPDTSVQETSALVHRNIGRIQLRRTPGSIAWT
ncbi:MAG: hypothetical protein IPP94_14905 [Ignavibacteria bacterium]|nr:hypothetical protein [Ignavibacteria bacterium]